MPEKLTRVQFSKLMYNRECRLDVWQFIAKVSQQNPPVGFTAREVLEAVNHNFPPSVIRGELNSMISLGMLDKVEGSRPLQYRADTLKNRLGELAWQMQDIIEGHYETTFGEQSTDDQHRPLAPGEEPTSIVY